MIFPDGSDFEFRRVFWSTQFKMNGTWITEKSFLEDERDALDVARSLRSGSMNTQRLRINKHTIESWEVTNELEDPEGD